MRDPAIRERLEAERARYQRRLTAVRRQLRRAAEHGSGELSSYDNHLADAASSTAGRTLAMTVARRLERQLQELDDALGRWAEGRYGRCERCGRRIDRDRLWADPATRWCRRCAADITSGRAAARRGALAPPAWADPAWLSLLAQGNSDGPQDRAPGAEAGRKADHLESP